MAGGIVWETSLGMWHLIRGLKRPQSKPWESLGKEFGSSGGSGGPTNAGTTHCISLPTELQTPEGKGHLRCRCLGPAHNLVITTK